MIPTIQAAQEEARRQIQAEERGWRLVDTEKGRYLAAGFMGLQSLCAMGLHPQNERRVDGALALAISTLTNIPVIE